MGEGSLGFERDVKVERPHRAGFVALLGPPNAGKSTLLNRLLGEKLAIVTPKPQTTRSRILGILNRPSAQILLLDTPGLHESQKRLNVALNDVVGEAVQDCDEAVLVVDAQRGWEETHDRLFEKLRARSIPIQVALNKIDVTPGDAPWKGPADSEGLGVVCPLSARTGEGVEQLLGAIEGALPESPAFYPDDHLTDKPVRWLCGEMVREAAFQVLEQEIPYAIAIDVLKYEQHPKGGVSIHANVLVARESQKRIVVGSGGRTVREIGTRARKEIERFLGERTHLHLFVKVDARWLESDKRMEALGYR